MRYRLVFIGLAAAFLAIIAAAVALSPGGDAPGLPPPLRAVSPVPGGADILQAVVRVEIETGYDVQFWIDGFRVPDGEVRSAEGIGRYEWSPDTSTTRDPWTPGNHTVRVVWDTRTGLPDPGEYTWSFRIQ